MNETLQIEIADQHPCPFNRWDEFPKHDSLIQQFELREKYLQQGMYAFVSWKWVDPLAKWIGKRKVLEVMAGRGHLAKALCYKGVDVIATDDYSWYTDKKTGHRKWDDPVFHVYDLDAVDAVKRYGSTCDVLVISWPYMDDIAYKVIREYHKENPKGFIVYIGEDNGGCTANELFFNHFKEVYDDEFELVKDNYERWWGIHDSPQLGIFTS